MKNTTSIINQIISKGSCSEDDYQSILKSVSEYQDLWPGDLRFDIVQDFHIKWIIQNNKSLKKWLFQSESTTKNIPSSPDEIFFHLIANISWDLSNKKNEVADLFITNDALYLKQGLIFRDLRDIKLTDIKHCIVQFDGINKPFVEIRYKNELLKIFYSPDKYSPQIGSHTRKIDVLPLLIYFLLTKNKRGVYNYKSISAGYVADNSENEKYYEDFFKLEKGYDKEELKAKYQNKLPFKVYDGDITKITFQEWNLINRCNAGHEFLKNKINQ